MSFISKIFSGGLSNILSGAGSIIDKFKLSPSDKKQFTLEMEALLQRQESELEQTYRQELNAKMEIIKAELTQGDAYTKRARPTIVYMGLIFILLEVFGVRHIILANVYDTSQGDYADILSASNEVFQYFLVAWASVVGVYGIGRTVEKTGVRSKVTNAITGSGAFQVESKSLQSNNEAVG